MVRLSPQTNQVAFQLLNLFMNFAYYKQLYAYALFINLLLNLQYI